MTTEAKLLPTADNALSALDEIEKAFWYAEKGDAFSAYGIALIKSSIDTLRALLQPSPQPDKCEGLVAAVQAYIDETHRSGINVPVFQHNELEQALAKYKETT